MISRLSLSFILLAALTSCASRPDFRKEPHSSDAEFGALLQKHYTRTVLRSLCTPDRKRTGLVQNPIIFGASNWEGRFVIEDDPEFRLWWTAIALNGHVEAYQVGVSRGKDFWYLDCQSSERIWRLQPHQVRELIKESERKPNQSPEPTAASGRGSS